ncbi:MAG: ArsJ-associated glyceraldehyde-3-phosphate dehydrogenase [Sedimenticolaceae bacterium]
MTVRVGINGFGRMGRLGLRAGWGSSVFEIVQVNEIATDAAGSAHLLQFDSVHGVWPVACDATGNTMQLEGSPVAHSSNAAIADTDWSGCDIVIEATGRHHKKPTGLQAYFDQGVKKVVVAAPTEGALNIVYGINHHLYDANVHHLVTAASCTTNCLAPVVKVMHEKIGIIHGCMTTIHDITNTQTIVDKGHKDLRRARACGQSLIPTTTGSAKAITRIFPELDGKLNGHAVRVPLLNASLTDFVFEAARPVSADEVNRHFRDAAEGELKGILGYEERPLVSVDYLNDPRSSIVDALSTMVIDGTQVKVYAWYDNEWGYVNRMMDIVTLIARGM